MSNITPVWSASNQPRQSPAQQLLLSQSPPGWFLTWVIYYIFDDGSGSPATDPVTVSSVNNLITTAIATLDATWMAPYSTPVHYWIDNDATPDPTNPPYYKQPHYWQNWSNGGAPTPLDWTAGSFVRLKHWQFFQQQGLAHPYGACYQGGVYDYGDGWCKGASFPLPFWTTAGSGNGKGPCGGLNVDWFFATPPLSGTNPSTCNVSYWRWYVGQQSFCMSQRSALNVGDYQISSSSLATCATKVSNNVGDSIVNTGPFYSVTGTTGVNNNIWNVEMAWIGGFDGMAPPTCTDCTCP